MTCRNCKHDKFAVDEMDGSQFHWCKKYYDCYDYNRADECEAYEPKTNADKIRNMTDEELYDFISGIDIYRCTCPAKSICDEESCEANFIKWLKQPVEGE